MKYTFVSSSKRLRFTFFLFIIGTILGIFVGNFFQKDLYAPLLNAYQSLQETIQNLEINRQEIFFIAARRNLKLILLLFLFSLTNLWYLYVSAFLLFTGFSQGLLLYFCVFLHDAGGVLHYFAFQFPQILVFLPLYLILILHSHTFHEYWWNQKETSKKGKLLFSQLPFLLFCLLLLLLGCFLEAGVNLLLLQKFL